MDVKRPRDARSLDHATLEEMRRLAIRRYSAGESQAEIARGMEVHPRTVAKWVALHRSGGGKALASRKATGRPPGLTGAEMTTLKELIVGKNPLQLNFGSALWSLPILQQVITQQFGKVLHQTTVARALGRMGLTPQKPSRRAFQRDDEACAQWASEVFPAIVRRARRKQATLLFGDETGVHENSPVGTTWAERGKRPTIVASGSRRRINVISFISARGRLWFRCYTKNLTAAVFIEFLEALIHDVKGFIVLVQDKHPAHVAAATRRWLHAHRTRIEVHDLPSYAPDMNPDEHVWGYLKQLFRRTPLSKEESFSTAVADAMKQIADDRPLVRAFFDHPEVSYVKNTLGW